MHEDLFDATILSVMISQTEKTKLRSWIEIDSGAIKKNFTTYKKMLRKDCILMTVVKSNAYGHGLVPFSKEVVKLGATYLGVDSFEEALELRKAGIKTRMMVFGYVSPEYYKEAGKKNISVTISNLEALRAAAKLKNKIKVHIKADTGLGRQGFSMNDLPKVLSVLVKNKYIEVEGLYSHLAVGEDPKKRDYTILQAKRLSEWEVAFNDAGYKPLKHICASSSTMLFPEFHFDMVRVGISMYGLWPSKETKQAVEKKYKLHPVLSWKTIIAEIKKVPAGSKIGYDLTEELKRDSILAVIPIGYWHGYPRIYSGTGIMNVRGKDVKVVGRVSMDIIVLDITDVKGAKVGDEVTVIGTKGEHYAKSDTDTVAQNSETINYEIVTRINPLLKRFVL